MTFKPEGGLERLVGEIMVEERGRDCISCFVLYCADVGVSGLCGRLELC